MSHRITLRGDGSCWREDAVSFPNLVILRIEGHPFECESGPGGRAVEVRLSLEDATRLGLIRPAPKITPLQPRKIDFEEDA